MNFLSATLEVLGITAPVFIVIAIGYFIRKKKIIGKESVQGLNKLAYNVGLPALVFVSIARYNFADIFNPEIIKIIYLTCAIFIPLVFILNFFIKVSDRTKGAMLVSSYRCNMAFVGFPIVLSAFGSLALARAGLVVAFLIPLNIISSVLIFKLYDRGKGNINVRKMLLSFILDPLILSAVLGIIFSYFSINLPVVLNRVLDILSGAGIALGLLSIGTSFSFFHIRKNLKLLFYVSAAKLILIPVIAFLLCSFVFKVDTFDRNIICILFSTPLAVVTFIMGKEYKSDHNFISSALILTTALSAVTISAWLLVLKLI